MERRHSEIREGAGLEESRINEDFKDFLVKWGPRILIVAALILGGYSGLRYYRQAQANKVDAAFSEYNSLVTGGTPTPEALVGVAEAHSGMRALPLMAKLQAADLYLNAVVSGLEPGFDPVTDFGPDGAVVDEQLVLDDEDRAFYLDEAEALYRDVLERSSGKAERAIHAIGAAFGLGAVAQMREETGVAREAYERARVLAEEHGFEPLAGVAADRIERLDEPVQLPTLYAQEQLPQPPEPEQPAEPGGSRVPTGLSSDLGDLFGPREPGAPSESAGEDAGGSFELTEPEEGDADGQADGESAPEPSGVPEPSPGNPGAGGESPDDDPDDQP